MEHLLSLIHSAFFGESRASSGRLDGLRFFNLHSDMPKIALVTDVSVFHLQ